ncbi:hypothetical protein L2E82_50137 [Cichorium intybus]|nr:hypothetical protein L2E82_50137 [Cichorium intybus]
MCKILQPFWGRNPNPVCRLLKFSGLLSQSSCIEALILFDDCSNSTTILGIEATDKTEDEIDTKRRRNCEHATTNPTTKSQFVSMTILRHAPREDENAKRGVHRIIKFMIFIFHRPFATTPLSFSVVLNQTLESKKMRRASVLHSGANDIHQRWPYGCFLVLTLNT